MTNKALALFLVCGGLLATTSYDVAQGFSEREHDRVDRSPVAPRTRQVQFRGSLTLNGVPSTRQTVFVVPANMRLVIEYVSCNVDVPQGQFMSVGLQTDGGGAAGFVLGAGTKQGTVLGEDIFALSELVKVFANPKTAVELFAHRSSSVGDTVGGCAITGELFEAGRD